VNGSCSTPAPRAKIDPTFAAQIKVSDATMLVSVDRFFDSRPVQLMRRAAQNTLPTAKAAEKRTLRKWMLFGAFNIFAHAN
jgi:hypothetical protein